MCPLVCVTSQRGMMRRCLGETGRRALPWLVCAEVASRCILAARRCRRALNRVKAMAAAWSLHHHRPQQHGQDLPEQQPPDPELWRQCLPDSLLLAVEGGILRRGDGGLYCFAWVAAQLAGGGVLSTPSMSPPQAEPVFAVGAQLTPWSFASFAGRVSTARSAEFLLPSRLAALVLGGMELGAADDMVSPSEPHIT